MAQATVSIRMDENLKFQLERLCDDIGMSMTTAFTVFAKRAVRERRIPFELTASPIYTETVTEEELLRRIAAMDAGQGREHELLEVDE